MIDKTSFNFHVCSIAPNNDYNHFPSISLIFEFKDFMNYTANLTTYIPVHKICAIEANNYSS